MKEKKEMEYEQAPSGYVTLYNYKEPFMSFKPGFGYEGVLLFDGETDKVQCHFCGVWYGALGRHLAGEHNMTAKQYKEKTGLNPGTALIGEKMRAKLIASGLDKRLQNLRKWKGIKRPQYVKDKIRASLKENRREQQNLHGTCPEQLVERFIQQAKELGRTPKSTEMSYYEAVVRTYGGMKRICELAGLPYTGDQATTLKKGRDTRMGQAQEKHKKFIFDFVAQNKRLPTQREGKDFWAYMYHSDKKKRQKLLNEAWIADGNWKGVNDKIRLEKEDLLKLLTSFEKNNGRKPSYSDCKRGLLPSLSKYNYYFGGWQNALKEAFKGGDKSIV